MKYTREKLNVLGRVFWLFQLEDSKFTLRADPQGIQFLGDSPHFETQQDLEAFAKLVAEAWKEHLALKPKFVSTLSGH